MRFTLQKLRYKNMLRKNKQEHVSRRVSFYTITGLSTPISTFAFGFLTQFTDTSTFI